MGATAIAAMAAICEAAQLLTSYHICSSRMARTELLYPFMHLVGLMPYPENPTVNDVLPNGHGHMGVKLLIQEPNLF